MLSGLASCNYPAFTGEEGSILQPNLISLNSLQSCLISQGNVHILLSAPCVRRSWADLAMSPIEPSVPTEAFPEPQFRVWRPSSMVWLPITRVLNVTRRWRPWCSCFRAAHSCWDSLVIRRGRWQEPLYKGFEMSRNDTKPMEIKLFP